MPLGVSTLPLELLINVVSFLNLEDFVNLKSTEKTLWETLQNESISREIVQVRLDQWHTYPAHAAAAAAAATAIDETS